MSVEEMVNMGCCERKLPKQRIDKMILHGIIGITKSLLGIDKADKNTIQGRLLDCSYCGYKKNNRCLQCGCFIKLKVKVKSEQCPIGLWG